MKTSSVLMLAAATGELLAQVQGFAPTAGLLPGAQRSVAATKRASLFTPGAKRGGLGCKCPGGCRCAQKTQLRMSSLADDVNADFEELFEANRDWIDFKKAQDPEFFKKNAAEHKPSVLWIGCADSRVPSNEVIGAESGEIFTHRNIANVVMNTDNSLMSGMTYAVDVLNVEHIVVCGHTKCGGVQASLSGPKEFSPPLEGWLSHLRMVYRHHRAELDAIADPDAKLERLVDLNVIEQCKNVYRTAIVQQRLADNAAEGRPYSTPRIHGCVYDLATGYLKRVNWVTDEMEDTYDMVADEGQSDKYNLQKLLNNNARWAEKIKSAEPDYFEKLGSSHTPSMMWIGCADSRVPSNEISGSEPGEIFTHRNIANVVMQTDQNLQGGLQYAVDALGVEHIVVCGHSNCGGIAASLTPTAFSPPLEGWLHHLANVYRLHASELDGIKDEKAKLRRLVELNVLEQCNNVAASSIVQAKQRESIAKGAPFPVPRIHGYVYDLENGALEDLQWSDQIADEGGVFKVRNDYAAMGMEDPNLKEKSMFNRKPAGMSGGGSVNPLKKMFGKK
mmetsp:Transcript_44941/g.112690  ORF Transcript_44941/g.112690 Transcript_44941/m.112690 type:complete len:561 (+) Transcript_44941:47-1729(+)